MYRATTPTHTFTFPPEIDPATLLEAVITYRQGAENVLEKTLADCRVEGQTLLLSLSQDETKRFGPGIVRLQVRIKTGNGRVLASQIIMLPVEAVLNEVVL